MSETKCALVEVPGLPYRVRSIADADEALEAFSGALNRYLHNHSEGHHSPRALKIIATGSDCFLKEEQIRELEQVMGSSLNGRSTVQSVVNHIRAQHERIARLCELLVGQGIHTDEYGFESMAPKGPP